MQPVKNIVALRQLLTEKFPGARFNVPDGDTQRCWATALTQIDDPLRGGLPKNAITEIVCEQSGNGSALLASALLRQAAQTNQFAAFVDGYDSLDVTTLDEQTLSRLLWVRCRSADEALKATDLLLRDGNVPLVLLDLFLNPLSQLRRIPSSTWFRLTRIIEERAMVLVVITPQALVSGAEARLVLNKRFSLDALEKESTALLSELPVTIASDQYAAEASSLRQSA
jgi:hypothetical protein